MKCDFNLTISSSVVDCRTPVMSAMHHDATPDLRIVGEKLKDVLGVLLWLLFIQTFRFQYYTGICDLCPFKSHLTASYSALLDSKYFLEHPQSCRWCLQHCCYTSCSFSRGWDLGHIEEVGKRCGRRWYAAENCNSHRRWTLRALHLFQKLLGGHPQRAAWWWSLRNGVPCTVQRWVRRWSGVACSLTFTIPLNSSRSYDYNKIGKGKKFSPRVSRLSGSPEFDFFLLISQLICANRSLVGVLFPYNLWLRSKILATGCIACRVGGCFIWPVESCLKNSCCVIIPRKSTFSNMVE